MLFENSCIKYFTSSERVDILLSRSANLEKETEMETKKITPQQVETAFENAERAELAVEKYQQQNGYSRSNNRTAELRIKAKNLRSAAIQIRVLFNAQ